MQVVRACMDVVAWVLCAVVCWFAWLQVAMVYRILYGG